VAGSEESPSAGLAPTNDDAPFSDSEDGESTAMSMDNMTARSMSSRSEGSTTDSLDRSLRQAAKTAGTRGIDYDEHEDLDAEYTNHEIAGAFKPWIKKGERLSFGDLSSHLDQENANPFPAKKLLSSDNPRGSLGNDMPGGVSRRGSLGNASVFGGDTMDFTNVVGGIVDGSSPSKDFSGESETAGDEDMTMEFTSVFGGVLAKNGSPVQGSNRDPDPYARADGRSPAALYPDLSEEGESESEMMEMEMEMTSAVGGILPPIEEHTEPLEDDTMGMDMTSAVGKILTPVRQARPPGPLFEEPEPNEPESSPFQEQVSPSPVKPGSGRLMAAVASENGSPSLKINPRRSLGSRKSTTPTRPSPRPPTTPRTPTTPRRQSPQKTGPKTPAKTPPSRKSRPVSASPKKPARLSQTKGSQSPGPLFRQDAQTGQSTPSFVLKPPAHTSLGIGIYKEGLGSPRVAELLDRRRSIGDDAETFVPGNKGGFGVRFESPSKFEKEVDELQNPHQAIREEQITFLAEKDPVLNLREMIGSLTPKKSKLKGRKSLHVGSAMGLLGKRPAELDDEEEELDHTPKRLKGREASPVKGIKLPAPPSKAETVGRVSRLSFKPVPEFTPKIQVSTTPKAPYRHKDVSDDLLANQQGSGETPAKASPDDAVQAHADSAVKPIQLSDFLEMTNIHFMELTTTKRRHTLAPDIGKKRLTESAVNGPPKDIGLEDCVAAGFCTLPMLELYQHVRINTYPTTTLVTDLCLPTVLPRTQVLHI
jgi:kinetochore protein Spc7/SPC105